MSTSPNRPMPRPTRGSVGRTNALVTSLLAAPLLVLSAVVPAMAAGPVPQEHEGNPFRGRQLFESKRCSACHSVWGHGGSLGPEISVVVAGKGFYDLVGDFWNHTPQMIDQIGRLGYSWPALDPDEMADVLSYLYYLRLFDESGSAARGRDAFERLQCVSCHSVGTRNAPARTPLDRFSRYASSTPLAEAMWNAGPRMQQAQRRSGMSIPQFSGREMADIQAHIRADGLRPGRDVTLQVLPSPGRGAVVYRGKGCGACHDGNGRQAPDLARATLSKTGAEITGQLWNHSYAMGSRMGARGLLFPRFSQSEMADLVAHLFFLGYVGREGSAKTGAVVFVTKGCAACHHDGRGGINLAGVVARADRAGLASAMWNHAPQMHRVMAERAAFWPKFESGEMRDLAAYIGSVSRRPQATPAPPGR